MPPRLGYEDFSEAAPGGAAVAKRHALGSKHPLARTMVGRASQRGPITSSTSRAFPTAFGFAALPLSASGE